MLKENPQQLKDWYQVRHERLIDRDRKMEAYEEIKADYNNRPNGADLLFVARSCYGGVVPEGRIPEHAVRTARSDLAGVLRRPGGHLA